VSHAREVLQVGDEVEVYIMNVDRDKRRIGLSLKQMQPDPWTQAAEKYTEGQLVEGTITNVTDFGAFARLEGDDIEGLIHVSELSDGRVDHPKEVVKKGDTLALRILRLEPHRRRMGLSLKSVAKAEYADLDWRMEQAAMLEEEESEEEAEETPQATPVDEDEAPQSEKLEAETEDEEVEEDLVEVESEEVEQSPEASSVEDNSS
jgi:small subunit ribosomal protein S1